MSSEFESFLRTRSTLKTFFEPLAGNNGDALITMGAKVLLNKLNVPLVSTPDQAQQILINGGGAMVDIWDGAGIKVLERYRRQFPNTPVIVAPSSFKFDGIDFASSCRAGAAELTLFARESYSLRLLQSQSLPTSTSVHLSQDLAFELKESTFLSDLQREAKAIHVLVALRKDKEGNAGILSKASGTWLPAFIRKPLSRLRDRLVARRSQGSLDQLITTTGTAASLPLVYRDVSVSVPFDEFTAAVKDSELILTDRLHVAILGHLLDKQVLLRPGAYHKIKGVYELSMSHAASRVRLVD